MKIRGIACVLFVLVPGQGSWGADLSIDVSVTIRASETPSNVHLQGEAPHGGARIELQKNRDVGIFSTSLILVPEGESEELRRSFRLTAMWTKADVGVPDDQDLFVAFGPMSPSPSNLTVYRLKPPASLQGVEQLDSLGDGMERVLQKYFGARSIYREISSKGLNSHVVALRSAKLWFDASVRLVQMDPTVYRMDSDIVAIIREYESKAKSDSGFAKRWRQYVKAGYVEGMLRPTDAYTYGFVGRIPALIRNNQLEEARRLNSIALRSLEGSQEPLRAVVEAVEGVNVEMLKLNEAYLNTLAESGDE